MPYATSTHFIWFIKAGVFSFSETFLNNIHWYVARGNVCCYSNSIVYTNILQLNDFDIDRYWAITCDAIVFIPERFIVQNRTLECS